MPLLPKQHACVNLPDVARDLLSLLVLQQCVPFWKGASRAPVHAAIIAYHSLPSSFLSLARLLINLPVMHVRTRSHFYLTLKPAAWSSPGSELAVRGRQQRRWGWLQAAAPRGQCEYSNCSSWLQ